MATKNTNLANKSNLSDKSGLAGLSLADLVEFCRVVDQPRYRAEQLYYWLYTKQVADFDAMTNIPKSFRAWLAENAAINSLTQHRLTVSDDGSTTKLLFQTHDGNFIESVLMHEGGRVTVCLSTQVGCKLDCQFCATAQMGFHRNLSVGEIIDQFLLLQRRERRRITNVVFMGMGEPFLNYQRVVDAAHLLNGQDGINLGARKITISTVGIIPAIRRFTAERQRFKLAISLNASDQPTRQRIMPIAREFPLPELLAAVSDYYQATRNRPTFEYVLLAGINDDADSARRLVDKIDGLPCKVNLIPYNEINGPYRRPSDDTIEAFTELLYNAPFTVTVRWSKGTGIKAGCGQLATENQPRD